MPKENSLRDKLEGNELDLSLNNLSVVPVKELAALPKATRLDLSCNAIPSLPDAFCSLIHLVKIDLSKNQLQELPHQFGQLQNLQHLDLLGNQLSVLPISFFQLRKLKWLDLKDNPMKEDLKKVAGDCLDEAQCKKCAQRVLDYMRGINSAVEREKQRKLTIQREKEAAIKALEEEEMQLKRERRKQAKAERQRQLQEERQMINNRHQENNYEEEEEEVDEVEIDGNQQTPSHQKGSGCCSWILWMAMFTMVIALLVGTFSIYQKDIEANPVYSQHVKPVWDKYGSPYWNTYIIPPWNMYGDPTWQKMKSFCLEKTKKLQDFINTKLSSKDQKNKKLKTKKSKGNNGS
ncbi:leucine-rich repeat-containing protein 59-like [Ylistrum balloti]|uniref:leucine-rich repeat-containing protein 59-like n=1 Tax=Ylistrum balloti TaxID=509963 RepID=UPI0029059560|nr:leucine-rich repeat-containing protein 59-like [Ylistrum balloti]